MLDPLVQCGGGVDRQRAMRVWAWGSAAAPCCDFGARSLQAICLGAQNHPTVLSSELIHAAQVVGLEASLGRARRDGGEMSVLKEQMGRAEDEVSLTVRAGSLERWKACIKLSAVEWSLLASPVPVRVMRCGFLF